MEDGVSRFVVGNKVRGIMIDGVIVNQLVLGQIRLILYSILNLLDIIAILQ